MLKECEDALLKHPGNIVEIGAGLGETTKHLLKLAHKYDRKVIVIDPFEHGWNEMAESYGKPYPLEGFHQNVKEHKDRLVIHQINSLSCEAEIVCENENIAFAFIDGLQYKGAVLNDLYIAYGAYVICIDDADRLTPQSQVPLALERYNELTKSKRELTIKGRWAFIK